jgi:hypothetical protein
LDDAGVEAILARLRDEVYARPSTDLVPSDGKAAASLTLVARREADRLAAVSADRPYHFRPGRFGRLRGMLLLPLKATLKPLMRWYVEPLAHDQRLFNGAAVRMIDELTGHVGTLLAENRELRARVDELSGEIVEPRRP